MSTSPFTKQFVLTRDYLAECYDEAAPYAKSTRPNYYLPAFFLTSGSGLLYFTDQPQIAGWMLVGLGILELVHIRFRRAWWLARQMWGASANSEVTLTIDDAGVQTHSRFVHTELLWADVDRFIETDLGFIMVNKAGLQQYVSKSLLPEELIERLIDLHKT